jgi:hypothetical protein
MKKKKQLLVDFLYELRNKGIADLHHEMTETIVKSFIKQRKKENKIASKLKIKDLERQLANKEVNKTWRKGALIKIIRGKFGHRFSIGSIVVAIEFSLSPTEGHGWECVDLETGTFWVSLDEGEVVG